MPSANTRIQNALTARLIDLLPTDLVAAFVGGTHTETLRDGWCRRKRRLAGSPTVH